MCRARGLVAVTGYEDRRLGVDDSEPIPGTLLETNAPGARPGSAYPGPSHGDERLLEDVAELARLKHTMGAYRRALARQLGGA